MTGKKLVSQRALQPDGCIWDFPSPHLNTFAPLRYAKKFKFCCLILYSYSLTN